jgi:hypothetical protein
VRDVHSLGTAKMRESRHRSYRPTVRSCWRVRSQLPSFAIVSLSLVQYTYERSESFSLLLLYQQRVIQRAAGGCRGTEAGTQPIFLLSLNAVPAERDTASGGCRGTETGTQPISRSL